MRLNIKNDNINITTLFICAVVVCILGAYGLGFFYHATFTMPARYSDLLIAPYRRQVFPEPDERFIFTALSGGVPLLCLCFSYLFLGHRAAGKELPRPNPWLIYVSAAVLFIGPMVGFEFSWWLLDEKHVQQWSPALLAACFIGAFSYYLYIQRVPARPTTHGFDRSGFLVFITATILQMAAWRVVGSHSVFYDTSWDLHFDAVIYTVSQVVMGKTLLYDLPSQYGLAPEILAPIFKLVRLTTRSFTSVCAILQLVSILRMACIGTQCQGPCITYLYIPRARHGDVRDCAIRARIGRTLLSILAYPFLLARSLCGCVPPV